jgi:hypothetical protein
MKLIALLLLMPCWAWACLPFNQPDVSTLAVRVTTPAGEAYGYLCKVGTNKTTRQVLWVPETFATLNKHRDPAKFVVASARAAASAVPEAAYAEVRAGSVKPAPGSMDEYEFKRLHHLACVEAAKLGPANSMPVTCEAAPTPPVVRWVVAKAAANASPTGTRPAFPWANGTRSTLSNGRVAQDTPCNPAVGRLEGATAYHGVNGRTDQVAVCVRQ